MKFHGQISAMQFRFQYHSPSQIRIDYEKVFFVETHCAKFVLSEFTFFLIQFLSDVDLPMDGVSDVDMCLWVIPFQIFSKIFDVFKIEKNKTKYSFYLCEEFFR